MNKVWHPAQKTEGINRNKKGSLQQEQPNNTLHVLVYELEQKQLLEVAGKPIGIGVYQLILNFNQQRTLVRVMGHMAIFQEYE